MYYIITSSKEIYDFAKRKGAKVFNTNDSIIIEDNKTDKGHVGLSIADKECELDVIDKFFNRFPEINKSTLGYKSVEHILKNKIKITIETRDDVYEQLAKEFHTTVSSIQKGITCVFKKLYVENGQHGELKELCDEIRKNPKARYRDEYAAELIRLLSNEYINKNCLKDEKKISSRTIDSFFEKFAYVNKNTLGYKCVKYILENGIECSGDYEKTIYPILTKHFKTKVKIIRQSLTYFFNNCRYNARIGMPEEFKKVYEQYNNEYARKSIEESNFAFISLCRNYLSSVC